MRHAFPAESLIETLVAITVIGMGTVAALTVMRTALSGNELIADKVVALNLSLEGLEALRNMRDTNYLRFASDPENCWNTYDVTGVAECSSGASVFEEGVGYSFERTFVDGVLLGWAVNAGATEDESALDLYSVDLNLDGTPDTELYAQTGLSDSHFTVLKSSVFSRTFTVEYNTDGSAYDATVTVTWTDVHGLPHSLDLTRTIRNIY